MYNYNMMADDPDSIISCKVIRIIPWGPVLRRDASTVEQPSNAADPRGSSCFIARASSANGADNLVLAADAHDAHIDSSSASKSTSPSAVGYTSTAAAAAFACVAFYLGPSFGGSLGTGHALGFSYANSSDGAAGSSSGSCRATSNAGGWSHASCSLAAQAQYPVCSA